MPVKVDDEEWKELRGNASILLAERKAYRRNGVRNLSRKAKSLEQQMNEANKLAADVIYRRHNKGQSHGKIDLHGLYRKEAIEYLDQRVADVKKNGLRNLTVIVGNGLHSENGPKLKPAVEN